MTKKSISNDKRNKFTLIGVGFGFLFPLIGTVIELSQSGLQLTLLNVIVLHQTNQLINIIDTAPIFLGLLAFFVGIREDRLYEANEIIELANDELQASGEELEQRVLERTSELGAANEKISEKVNQLRIVADVARSGATVKDLKQLLDSIALLISQRFEYYHIGIFLVDENREFAILRAASSEGGKKMINNGHRIKIGRQGIVGNVTFIGKHRIALDVGVGSVIFDNPDLPETHSEMALPLKIAGEIIGALDLQSKERNAFTQDDVDVLSILADQVAISIQSTRFVEEAELALKLKEATSKRESGLIWKSYLPGVKVKGYIYDGLTPKPYTEKQHKKLVSSDQLSIPIKIRGNTIGRIHLNALDPNREWSNNELLMAKAVADRTGLALEIARLIEDARNSVSKEQVIGEISASINAARDVESILQTTVEELGRRLSGASGVTIEMANITEAPSLEPDNRNNK
ncbi:MAG: GAF domain-containing protein [Anaerolineae bacterium]|nr:GAF domain-containing protein [Anaerolineae bacterium]MDK1080064.1 GAF domain-containing protein [Anaerolineae bacterium]